MPIDILGCSLPGRSEIDHSLTTSQFSFELPEELIAQYPPPHREDARIMVLDRSRDGIVDGTISDFVDLTPPGALLVCNNSRVRSSRCLAKSEDTGTEVELLLLEPLAAPTASSKPAEPGTHWLAMMRRQRRQRLGRRYRLEDGTIAELIEKRPGAVEMRFSRPIDDDWLAEHGKTPLPPYIKRPAEALDRERYQCVYAETFGSVAAPTAGLHFGPDLLGRLERRGVEVVFITLHVGVGTFESVRSDRLQQHRMHRERFVLSDRSASTIESARREGRPIIAVGTTSVRSIEAAWQPESQRLRRGEQETDIFIYPPYRFRVVDRVVTNFHAPRSTPLMLVCAFAGRERVLAAYRQAIALRYRFFSYGDAMYLY